MISHVQTTLSMLVGTGTFTADNTFIRTPIWLTPANLGYKRANNYITLFLDVIDVVILTYWCVKL